MPRRLFLRLLLVARLAVAVGCFQLSGYGHLVNDLLVSMGVMAEHDDDCSNEGDHECPPGCPTCHCTHCVTPALPAAPRDGALAPATTSLVSAFDAGERTPITPDLPQVFRPPRATA